MREATLDAHDDRLVHLAGYDFACSLFALITDCGILGLGHSLSGFGLLGLQAELRDAGFDARNVLPQNAQSRGFF